MASKEEIEFIASGFGREVRRLEDAGEKQEAYKAKCEWSYYRDSLSGPELEICVEAYVSAHTPLSPAAQALLEKKAGE